MLSIKEAIAKGTTSNLHIPSYNRGDLSVGMAHIGVGNFHRAFQIVYLDDLLEKRKDQNKWGSLGIGLMTSPASVARAKAMAIQDCNYTHTEFSPDGEINSRILSPILEYLHEPKNSEAIIRRLSDPNIKIVSMTIGEGGYDIDEANGEFKSSAPHILKDLKSNSPETIWGIIVAALKARRKAGIDPFTVLSCDNLRSNGNTTRKATVGFATALDAELGKWIDGNVSFPNSMVDRVAPTIDENFKNKLNEITGVNDLIPVAGESFRQWVIEDEFPYGRPAWEEVGVQLRSDVEAFEAMKGRTLNSTHVISSYPSLVIGMDYVYEAFSDDLIQKFLLKFMGEDAIPLITPPVGVSMEDYKVAAIKRFSNKNLPDTLLRVASDGSSKIPTFHRKTTEMLMAKGGDLRRLALLFAAYRLYLLGVSENGRSFEPIEPKLSDSDISLIKSSDPINTLKATPFSSWKMYENENFMSVYLNTVETIKTKGMRAAIAAAIA